MGYTTEFEGAFKIEPALKPEHKAYLAKFADVRHMRRDPIAAEKMPDPLRHAVDLPIGVEGEHYVGSTAHAGQDRRGEGGVLDFNAEPSMCPGLWCQWTPSDDGAELAWDGGEKFYNYVEWLEYLIDTYLAPWGYKVSGEVTWQGESHRDNGKIRVEKNTVMATVRRR